MHHLKRKPILYIVISFVALITIMLVASLIVSSQTEASLNLDGDYAEHEDHSAILGIEPLQSDQSGVDSFRVYRNVGTYSLEFLIDVSTVEEQIIDAYELNYRILGGTFEDPEVVTRDQRASFQSTIQVLGGLGSHDTSLHVDIQDDEIIVTY
ncbi:hypothetical protein JCM19037_3041 [Geomicrobium sp. JCM 19037]|uniref:hypothetical protein n=1 Tax=Geomicrobium sp. JCM 19037 TaxID=1460634 RepID=UPI00045F24B6|nr:hypothetical protein [Geomicrobium sp. JCM 19037]GAK04609.1 hypothetical protein JCM19037_3041 [Geomicrobium sp. JCM 19037]